MYFVEWITFLRGELPNKHVVRTAGAKLLLLKDNVKRCENFFTIDLAYFKKVLSV